MKKSTLLLRMRIILIDKPGNICYTHTIRTTQALCGRNEKDQGGSDYAEESYRYHFLRRRQ